MRSTLRRRTSTLDSGRPLPSTNENPTTRQPADRGKVSELGGRKSLYSTSYFEPEEFWRTYNGDRYEVLKKEYDPHGRLLDLYAKCVVGR